MLPIAHLHSHMIILQTRRKVQVGPLNGPSVLQCWGLRSGRGWIGGWQKMCKLWISNISFVQGRSREIWKLRGGCIYLFARRVKGAEFFAMVFQSWKRLFTLYWIVKDGEFWWVSGGTSEDGVTDLSTSQVSLLIKTKMEIGDSDCGGGYSVMLMFCWLFWWGSVLSWLGLSLFS